MDFEKPEDLFKNMDLKIPQFRFNKGMLPIVALVIVGILIATSIYSTGPDEVGVIPCRAYI